MKIKEGFILRKIMGNYVVVAVGEASKSFRGMITLNETAADIWNLLEKGCEETDIYDALFEKYDVDRDRLTDDVSKILATLQAQGILEI